MKAALLVISMFLPRAEAAERLLVYESDAVAAVERAAAAECVPPADFHPVRLSDLLAGPGPVVKGAAAATCAGPPAQAPEVRAAAELALDHYFHRNIEAAGAAVETALAGIACQSDPIEPSLAARVWFLRGVLDLEGGREEAAREAWAHARVFAPGLAWDADFGPESPLYAPPPPTGSAGLWIGTPGGPALAALVDGRPQVPGRVALSPGEHLLQVPGSPTVRVHLDAGAEAVVFLPDSPGPGPSDGMADGAWREWFGAVTADRGPELWVAAGRDTWRLDGSGWTRLDRAPADTRAPARRRWGQGLVVAGLSAGTAFGLDAWGAARDYEREREAHAGDPEYEAALWALRDEAHRSRSRAFAGAGIAAATAAGGIALWAWPAREPCGTTIEPTAGAGSAGISVVRHSCANR